MTKRSTREQKFPFSVTTHLTRFYRNFIRKQNGGKTLTKTFAYVVSNCRQISWLNDLSRLALPILKNASNPKLFRFLPSSSSIVYFVFYISGAEKATRSEDEGFVRPVLCLCLRQGSFSLDMDVASLRLCLRLCLRCKEKPGVSMRTKIPRFLGIKNFIIPDWFVGCDWSKVTWRVQKIGSKFIGNSLDLSSLRARRKHLGQGTTIAVRRKIFVMPEEIRPAQHPNQIACTIVAIIFQRTWNWIHLALIV